MLANGIPLNILSLWLGHSSIEPTLVYVKLLPDPAGTMRGIPRHPRGVLARLRPYESYYWSPEYKEDQPPFPTTLFVVDTEGVEDTYVHTATRMSRMSLPILVSSIPVLSIAGILGRSWRPLWEPESPRLPLSGLSAYQGSWLSLQVQQECQGESS